MKELFLLLYINDEIVTHSQTRSGKFMHRYLENLKSIKKSRAKQLEQITNEKSIIF